MPASKTQSPNTLSLSNFAGFSISGSISRSRSRTVAKTVAQTLAQDMSHALMELNQNREIKDIFQQGAVNEFVFCAKIKRVGKNSIKFSRVYKMEFSLEENKILFNKISKSLKMHESQSFEFCHFLKNFKMNISKNHSIDKYVVFAGTYLKDINCIVNTHHFDTNNVINITKENSYSKAIAEIKIRDNLDWNYKMGDINAFKHKCGMVKLQIQKIQILPAVSCY